MANLLSITIDCNDARRLAGFWTMALDGYMADESHVVLKSDSGPTIYFQQVPEPKSGKNRLHLDIGARDARGEIFRLERLGAKVIAEMSEGGHEWVILGDPEGNEFCVTVVSG